MDTENKYLSEEEAKNIIELAKQSFISDHEAMIKKFAERNVELKFSFKTEEDKTSMWLRTGGMPASVRKTRPIGSDYIWWILFKKIQPFYRKDTSYRYIKVVSEIYPLGCSRSKAVKNGLYKIFTGYFFRERYFFHKKKQKQKGYVLKKVNDPVFNAYLNICYLFLSLFGSEHFCREKTTDFIFLKFLFGARTSLSYSSTYKGKGISFFTYLAVWIAIGLIIVCLCYLF